MAVARSDNPQSTTHTSHHEDMERVYRCVESILAERGVKSCTMDLAAARLGISKRTLYEIFPNKEEMVKQVLTNMHERHRRETEEIFRTSANMMEAMARHAFASQHLMQTFSRRFFIDLHRYRHLHDHVDRNQECIQKALREVIHKGVEQGVFRKDVNYEVTLRLVHLQHESLSCMHEIFPPEVTMAQAFEAITIGFLRSIATPGGMRILDALTDTLQPVKDQDTHKI